MAFDEKGLRSIGPLKKSATIHGKYFLILPICSPDPSSPYLSDLSVPVENDYGVRHRTGTLTDLLRCSQSDRGKSLNALSFPRIFASTTPHPFSSEAIAWHYVQGRAWCKWGEGYPVSTLRFGLAATAGAYHKFHIDSDGTGTFVEAVAGRKIWVLAVPKEADGLDGLADIDLFGEAYDMEDPNLDLWDLEAVILQPGVQL